MRKWITLIICLAIPWLVGYTSSLLTANESGGPWYRALEKPSFNPPSWVFGPVWTTLYILMGVSLYLVYQAPRSSVRQKALWSFAIQLVLNFLWSLIFFRWHMLGLAAIEIFALLIVIGVMIALFYKVRPTAAYLQLPYIVWVSFATVLTISIYWLNRVS